jgi:hypothetical protein
MKISQVPGPTGSLALILVSVSEYGGGEAALPGDKTTALARANR